MTAYRHGVPAWNDVSSPDIPLTAAFYCGLFGWDVSPDQGEEFGGYRLFLKGDAPVAGIGPSSDAPPAWTTYVNVTNTDAAAERIAAHGGTVVVPPMDLPGGNGRIAFALDPAGGFVGLFQAGPNHIGAVLVNEENTVVWHEYNVRDAQRDAALAFYESVFGWTTNAMDDSPMAYRVVGFSGRNVGGVMTMGEQFPEHVPTHWLPYFVVADAHAAAARCTELGGGVVMPPWETPMGPMGVLRDPTGGVFAVAAMGNTEDPNAWPE